MRIEISQLKEGPVRYDVRFSPAFLAGDGLQDDARFGEATGTVVFTMTGDEITAQGALSVQAHGRCGRCLAEVTAPVSARVQLFLWPRAKFETWEKQEEEDEEQLDTGAADVACYSGDSFDPDEDLREILLLETPQVFLCSEECKGLCPDCGADLNREACACKNRHADGAEGEEKIPAWKKKLKDIRLE